MFETGHEQKRFIYIYLETEYTVFIPKKCYNISINIYHDDFILALIIYDNCSKRQVTIFQFTFIMTISTWL